MTILDELALTARERVKRDKEKIGVKEMCSLALKDDLNTGSAFYEAIKKDDLSFICEIKKASPSKGIIDPKFDYMAIATDYEKADADCISCLTEPSRFLGSDEIFKEVRAKVKTPMIRKDFTVDEYQIYQAKAMGANCVLLICTLLDEKTLSSYLRVCEELDLAALTETHDAEEIKKAVSVGAKMIGVNNRNLKDFSVDFENAARLRELIPSDILYVAESGVVSSEDVKTVKKIGADGVLMGEALMRATDRVKMLESFRNAIL